MGPKANRQARGFLLTARAGDFEFQGSRESRMRARSAQRPVRLGISITYRGMRAYGADAEYVPSLRATSIEIH